MNEPKSPSQSETAEILTREQVDCIRRIGRYGLTESITIAGVELDGLCDSHERLRAELEWIARVSATPPGQNESGIHTRALAALGKSAPAQEAAEDSAREQRFAAQLAALPDVNALVKNADALLAAHRDVRPEKVMMRMQRAVVGIAHEGENMSKEKITHNVESNRLSIQDLNGQRGVFDLSTIERVWEHSVTDKDRSVCIGNAQAFKLSEEGSAAVMTAVGSVRFGSFSERSTPKEPSE